MAVQVEHLEPGPTVVKLAERDADGRLICPCCGQLLLGAPEPVGAIVRRLVPDAFTED